MTRSTFLFLTAALMAATAAPALAANTGGGGMSGGSMPSQSAPAFDAAAEYRKGVQALKDSKYREAEKAFGRVASVVPKDANVLTLLGTAKAGKGDLKGAKGAYEKALKAQPGHVLARQELAITLAKLRQPDQAQAELAQLKTRAAACNGACAEAASLTAAVGAVEAAMQVPAAPVAALAAPSLLFADASAGDQAYGQAVALINQRRYAEALTELARARQAFGPHPDLLTYIGYTHRKLGAFDVAETYYQQALALAPDHRGATEYYGELKVQRGDLAGARRMLAKLDAACAYGCAEAEELRRWIDQGPPAS